MSYASLIHKFSVRYPVFFWFWSMTLHTNYDAVEHGDLDADTSYKREYQVLKKSYIRQ
jgi:hypothetical protein